MYDKTLNLAELVGSSEQRPRICSRQRNRENYPSDSVADYCKRSVVVPFLYVICAELTSRFSEDKRARYELCTLIPAVIAKKSPESVIALNKTLMEKWSNIMPISSAFDSELFRWYNSCRTNRDALAGVSSSATSMLADGGTADGIFSLNVQELLVVLAVQRQKDRFPAFVYSTFGSAVQWPLKESQTRLWLQCMDSQFQSRTSKFWTAMLLHIQDECRLCVYWRIDPDDCHVLMPSS